MIISAKGIKKAKARRVCCSCFDVLRGPHIRLYGAAHQNDPPHVIYLCIDCVGRGQNEKETVKIQKAIMEANDLHHPEGASQND